MADRLERALGEGRAPFAPGFVGWLATLCGLATTAVAVSLTDWGAVARCWSGDCTPSDLTPLLWIPIACASGAVGGSFLARRGLGPARWRARLRWRPLPAPRSSGLMALALAVVGAAFALALAPSFAVRGDPGWALVSVLTSVVFAVGLMLGLPAMVERGRARAAWQRLVDPQPPPVHDDDDLAPALRAALRARPPPRHERLAEVRLVITRGDYAVAIGAPPDKAPRVIAHGGPELLAALAVPCVESPALADVLASTPAGEPAPAAAWPALHALLGACSEVTSSGRPSAP